MEVQGIIDWSKDFLDRSGRCEDLRQKVEIDRYFHRDLLHLKEMLKGKKRNFFEGRLWELSQKDNGYDNNFILEKVLRYKPTSYFMDNTLYSGFQIFPEDFIQCITHGLYDTFNMLALYSNPKCIHGKIVPKNFIVPYQMEASLRKFNIALDTHVSGRIFQISYRDHQSILIPKNDVVPIFEESLPEGIILEAPEEDSLKEGFLKDHDSEDDLSDDFPIIEEISIVPIVPVEGGLPEDEEEEDE